MFPVQFTTDAVDGSARAGTAVTHRGSYTTPCFMPVGTLLMIQSFVGTRWRELYEQAIAREYRMLSFGDAMLLARRTD